MTDTSPEAVERLLARLDRAAGSEVLPTVYLGDRTADWCAAAAAATLRALAAENARLRAENGLMAQSIDAKEIEAGLSTNGGFWRWWASQAREQAAERDALADDLTRLKGSETHWLDEAERLQAALEECQSERLEQARLLGISAERELRLIAERDAAYQRGAEAMRGAAAAETASNGAIVDHPSVFMGGPSRNAKRIAEAFADAIRALPIPDKEGEA